MNPNEFLTPAVIWFLAGLVLLLLELAIPGLIIVFFGVGAWLTSLCLLIFNIDINLQLVIFIIGSVTSLLVFRKYLKNKFFHENSPESKALDEEFVGKSALADTDLKAGIPGKINFKGTQWTAVSDMDIMAGEYFLIKDKESITLKITRK